MRVWGIEVDDPVNARNARRIFVAHLLVSCFGFVLVIWAVALVFGALPRFQQLEAPDQDVNPGAPATATPAPAQRQNGPRNSQGQVQNNGYTQTGGYQTGSYQTGGYDPYDQSNPYRPVAHNGPPDDPSTACRRNGRWHDAKENAKLSFVCQGSCPGPMGSAWQEHNHTCYFRPPTPSNARHGEAEMACKAHGAHLVMIKSATVNEVVRSVCGARECWIALQKQKKSKDWLWTDGSYPLYENWEQGEPNAKGSGNKGAFLNWGGACAGPNSYYGRFDTGQVAKDDTWRLEHEVMVERCRIWTAFWGLLHIGLPILLFVMMRMILDTKSASIAQCLCVCDGVGSSCIAIECVLSLFILLALAGGISKSEDVEADDYDRGGPVRCAQDPTSIGYKSAQDCEDAYVAQLRAFYVFLVIISCITFPLCLCALHGVQQVHVRLRGANPIGAVKISMGGASASTYQASSVPSGTAAAATGVVVGSPIAVSTSSQLPEEVYAGMAIAGARKVQNEFGHALAGEEPTQPFTKTVD